MLNKIPLNTWYDANDKDLKDLRLKAKDLCFAFNSLPYSDEAKGKIILKQLFASLGDNTEILAPLYCDYGQNITIGKDCYINHGAYLMDTAPITIGDHCFIGPFLNISCASHPLDIANRNKGLEMAKSVVIEDDVWIGSNVTILGGVTIGRGSVIGAGSLVTKDIPANTLAYGNPAKAVRKIEN